MFRRRNNTPSKPFWEIPPFRTSDPRVLYQHGIKCVTESDGPGMMTVGWALWDVWGLAEHEAWDFLYDGYNNWSDAGAPTEERVQFARAVFDRLQSIQPEIAPTNDLGDLAQATVAPASRYYSSRCWAASELLELSRATGLLTSELKDELHASLAAVHWAFMPPRTSAHFEALSAERGDI